MNKRGLAGREYYIDLLDKNTNSFRKGEGKNIALLGPRRCGKTSILKHHAQNSGEIISVYIDVEKISLNPENFAVEFVWNIIQSSVKKTFSESEGIGFLEKIKKHEAELGKNSFSLIKTIENELLKIKPDQRLLVKSAFDFANVFGTEKNKKILLLLDNFENIFDLNNFSQVKDAISLIDYGAKYVRYVVASSAVRECISLLKNFECFEIKNLEKSKCVELIESIIGNANRKACEEIFSFSKGHPFVAVSIAKRFLETKDAKKAFLVELLVKDSPVYNYCSESYNYYYNRARGQTLLKTILKVVASEELRLSEIAKKIYRSAPVTKAILERLIDADIIHKKDNKFYFGDDVLRVWVKLTSDGYDFIDSIDDKILEEAGKKL
ncbi:MAG TPA: hypothetical protein VI564_06160 [Candidatus Nanoarchaeia archaeon]|nr:hypothetical protein [Candidatus Nanoarchaeia archaeon]